MPDVTPASPPRRCPECGSTELLADGPAEARRTRRRWLAKALALLAFAIILTPAVYVGATFHAPYPYTYTLATPASPAPRLSSGGYARTLHVAEILEPHRTPNDPRWAFLRDLALDVNRAEHVLPADARLYVSEPFDHANPPSVPPRFLDTGVTPREVRDRGLGPFDVAARIRQTIERESAFPAPVPGKIWKVELQVAGPARARSLHARSGNGITIARWNVVGPGTDEFFSSPDGLTYDAWHGLRFVRGKPTSPGGMTSVEIETGWFFGLAFAVAAAFAVGTVAILAARPLGRRARRRRRRSAGRCPDCGYSLAGTIPPAVGNPGSSRS